MAKIYLINNNNNGKQYVGETTRNVSQRFAEHISAAFRYYKTRRNDFYKDIAESGENVFNVFTYDILEECNDDSRFERELYYIEKYKPQYNEDGKEFFVNSVKNKIIEEYTNGSNVTEIRKKYKCRHQLISAILKEKNIEIKRSRPKNCKKVYLFDDNGNVIKEWINAGECSQELKIDRSNIRICCISNTKNNYLYNSANGYHFKYTKDTPLDMFEIEKDGEIIRFKSKNAFVNYFKNKFPDKNIQYGQLTRNRKKVYGYKIKVLNSLKKERNK